jgi:hypothetical protein
VLHVIKGSRRATDARGGLLFQYLVPAELHGVGTSGLSCLTYRHMLPGRPLLGGTNAAATAFRHLFWGHDGRGPEA